MKNKSIREQPFGQISQTVNTEGEKENFLEFQDLEIGDNLKKGSLGKFKNTEALLSAYNNLQAEFTRKCQKLKLLENQINSNLIDNDQDVQNQNLVNESAQNIIDDKIQLKNNDEEVKPIIFNIDSSKIINKSSKPILNSDNENNNEDVESKNSIAMQFLDENKFKSFTCKDNNCDNLAQKQKIEKGNTVASCSLNNDFDIQNTFDDVLTTDSQLTNCLNDKSQKSYIQETLSPNSINNAINIQNNQDKNDFSTVVDDANENGESNLDYVNQEQTTSQKINDEEPQIYSSYNQELQDNLNDNFQEKNNINNFNKRNDSLSDLSHNTSKSNPYFNLFDENKNIGELDKQHYENLFKDKQFLEKFIQSNKSIRDSIVISYLEEIMKTNSPKVIGETISSGIVLGKPPRPQNLDEAKDIVTQIFS